MKDLLKYTKERSSELAEYLELVSAAPLMFEGDEPLQHSSHNHIHLSDLEYLAESNSWINAEYRAEFVEYVFEQWRRRLKGLKPYRERGYRIYVYETWMAPVVSVVAETDVGFPYDTESGLLGLLGAFTRWSSCTRDVSGVGISREKRGSSGPIPS